MRKSIGIYWETIFVGIFTYKLYRWVKSVGKHVGKSYTSSYCFSFFIFSFPTAILLVYTNIMFLSVFTEGYSDGKVH